MSPASFLCSTSPGLLDRSPVNSSFSWIVDAQSCCLLNVTCTVIITGYLSVIWYGINRFSSKAVTPCCRYLRSKSVMNENALHPNQPGYTITQTQCALPCTLTSGNAVMLSHGLCEHLSSCNPSVTRYPPTSIRVCTGISKAGSLSHPASLRSSC